MSIYVHAFIHEATLVMQGWVLSALDWLPNCHPGIKLPLQNVLWPALLVISGSGISLEMRLAVLQEDFHY